MRTAVAVVAEELAGSVETDADGGDLRRGRFVSTVAPAGGLLPDALGHQCRKVPNEAARHLAVQGFAQILLHDPGIAVAVFGGNQLGQSRGGVADDACVLFEGNVGAPASGTPVGEAFHLDGTGGCFVFFGDPFPLRGELRVAEKRGNPSVSKSARARSVTVRPASLSRPWNCSSNSRMFEFLGIVISPTILSSSSWRMRGPITH